MDLNLFYFVEGDIVSIKNIFELLHPHNIGEDSLIFGRKDERGVPHDVLAVPSYLVATLLKARERDYDKELHQFTLYTSEFPEGELRPFVEQEEEVATEPPKPTVKSLRQQIKGIFARRAMKHFQM